MDVTTDQKQTNENALGNFQHFIAVSQDDQSVLKHPEANTCNNSIPQNLNKPQTLVEYLSEKLKKTSRLNKPRNWSSQSTTSLHKKSETSGVPIEPQGVRLSATQRFGESKTKLLTSSSQSLTEDTSSGARARNKQPNNSLERKRINRKSREQRNAANGGTYSAAWMKTQSHRANLRPRVTSSSSDSSVDTNRSSTDELFKVRKRHRAPGRYIVGRHFHKLCKNLTFRTSSSRSKLPPVTLNKHRLSDYGLGAFHYKNNQRSNFFSNPRSASQHGYRSLSDNERKRRHMRHSHLSRWATEYKPRSRSQHSFGSLSDNERKCRHSGHSHLSRWATEYKPRSRSQYSFRGLSDNERKRRHVRHSHLSRWTTEYKPKKIKHYDKRLDSRTSTREGSPSTTANDEYSCSSSMSSSKPLRTALRNKVRRKRTARKRCVHFDPRLGKRTPTSTSKCKPHDGLKQSEHKCSSHSAKRQPRPRSKTRNSVPRNERKQSSLTSSSDNMPPVYTSGEGSLEDTYTPLPYKRLLSDDESMK